MDLFNTENQNEEIKQKPATEKKRPSRGKKATAPSEENETSKTETIPSPKTSNEREGLGEKTDIGTGGLQESSKHTPLADAETVEVPKQESNSNTIEPTGEEVSIEVKSGAGDVVSSVTKFLGIKECEGCKERKEKLNRAFPFTRKARNLTSEEVKFLNKLKNDVIISKEEANRFKSLYEDVFKTEFTHCDCPAKYRTAFDRFKTVVEYYKQISK